MRATPLTYGTTLEDPEWKEKISRVIVEALRAGMMPVVAATIRWYEANKVTDIYVNSLRPSEEFTGAAEYVLDILYAGRGGGGEIALRVWLCPRSFEPGVTLEDVARLVIEAIEKLVVSEEPVMAFEALSVLLDMFYRIYGVLGSDADYEATLYNIGGKDRLYARVHLRYNP